MVGFRYDREQEREFINVPVMTAMAGEVVSFTKEAYSNRHYEAAGKNLRIAWRESERFTAAALEDAHGDHVIELAYGTAIEIYRDAFVFPETCQRVFPGANYDPIYDLLSYGNRREDVLPEGLTPLDAKILITQYSLQWLYLHEQAHLFQNHRTAATRFGSINLLGNKMGIDDSENQTQPISGRDAALRHAFEFAADYEATTLLVLKHGTEKLTPAKLWCWTAAMMCMFMRFYNRSHLSVDSEPIGSHPHPALRMRMVARKIEDTLLRPHFAEKMGWIGGALYARRVMDHAIYSADLYWHMRYFELEKPATFLDYAVALANVPEAYQKAVDEAWDTVRPFVVRNHMGEGEGVTMFIKHYQCIGTKKLMNVIV